MISERDKKHIKKRSNNLTIFFFLVILEIIHNNDITKMIKPWNMFGIKYNGR